MRSIYVVTENQSLRVLCQFMDWKHVIEYLTDDARRQSFIRYAVLPKDSQFVNYDMNREDFDTACNAAGVDLTDAPPYQHL